MLLKPRGNTSGFCVCCCIAGMTCCCGYYLYVDSFVFWGSIQQYCAYAPTRSVSGFCLYSRNTETGNTGSITFSAVTTYHNSTAHTASTVLSILPVYSQYDVLLSGTAMFYCSTAVHVVRLCRNAQCFGISSITDTGSIGSIYWQYTFWLLL